MNRLTITVFTAALSAAGAFAAEPAATNSKLWDKKLARDQQIVHALNRLTFGPRPGDVDEVRHLGLEKWIAAQLHPERLAENPALDQRLQPLETLRLAPEALIKDYPQVPAAARLSVFKPFNEFLSPDEIRRVLNGTAEERAEALKKMDPDKRRQTLLILAPPLLANLPDMQKEAAAARQAQAEETQKAVRKLMPPLNELLNADQMRAATRGTPAELTELLASLDETKRQQVAAALPPQVTNALPEVRRLGLKLRQPQQVLTDDLRQGKIFRALYSNRQLEEVLVDFWFNHFNVFEGKQNVRPLIADYENNAIRPHVLGKFKDLLVAVAKHPAMLYYLDNWESISPAAFDIGPFAGPPNNMAQQMQRAARGLNENYGRELMELHTLGVDGGYTQADVIAVARCFTGWTVRQPNTKPEFVFAGFMHDTAEKTVLGQKIAAGGGVEDGTQVIDILARHPSTARFISRKLAQRFVADEPPPALVVRMAQTFTKTDGDLRAVLAAMFTSPEFLSEGAWQAKIKSPLEMTVSAARAVGAEVIDTFTLAQRINDLGEPLYGKVEPTGYANTGEAWLNTANLMGRMNFAAALAGGKVPGVKPPLTTAKEPAEIAKQVLAGEASPQLLSALRDGLGKRGTDAPLVTGLVLGSPDFQKR